MALDKVYYRKEKFCGVGIKDDGIVPCMDPYKAMDLLKEQLKSSPKVYEDGLTIYLSDLLDLFKNSIISIIAS